MVRSRKTPLPSNPLQEEKKEPGHRRGERNGKDGNGPGHYQEDTGQECSPATL